MLAIPQETQKAHNLLVRLLDHGSRKRPPWSKKTKSCCVIGCYGYDYGYVRKNLLRTFGTYYHPPCLPLKVRGRRAKDKGHRRPRQGGLRCKYQPPQVSTGIITPQNVVVIPI